MQLSARLLDTEFQPRIRDMFLQMDNCCGTNKSQYAFGTLAYMAVLGIIDLLWIAFMLPGHTKFAPDEIAQAIDVRYNTQDTFNMAQLLGHAELYCTSRYYDGELLSTWKAASSQVFNPVENITSYRNFMLIANDEELKLGPGRPSLVGEFPNKGMVYIRGSSVVAGGGVSKTPLSS